MRELDSEPLTDMHHSEHHSNVEGSTTQPGVIEIELPPNPQYLQWHLRRLPWLVLIAILCLAVIVPPAVLLGRLVNPGPVLSVAMLVVLAVMSVVLGTGEWRRFRVWSTVLKQQAAQYGLPAAVAAMLQSDRVHAQWILRPQVCRDLARSGHTNLTIRIGGPNPITVEPFVQPFEARRFREWDRGFRELVAAADAMIAPGHTLKRPPKSLARRLVAGVGLVFIGTALLLFITERWSRGGLLDVAQLFAVLLLLAAALAFIVSRRPQWLLVPGGMIFRHVRLLGPVRLHLFDRRSSLLVAAGVRDRWRITVADAEQGTTSDLPLGAEHVDIFLRAWLSPLPPPAVETLTDLR